MAKLFWEENKEQKKGKELADFGEVKERSGGWGGGDRL